jgi:xanthine dehydrogenase YagS FAD-binding subunit
VAVNPSDTAPACIALDAKFVVVTPKNQQAIDAEDYFVGPDLDITRMNILRPGYLLTAIRIPSTWARSDFYFEKARDRNVWRRGLNPRFPPTILVSLTTSQVLRRPPEVT